MRLMVRVRPGGRVERKKDEREIVGVAWVGKQE
jgi:hypothetical protein